MAKDNDGWEEVPSGDSGWEEVPDPTPVKKETTPVENIAKIVQESRGYSPMGFAPTSVPELTDLGKVLLRQFIPDQPGLVGMGASMVGAKSEGLPEPETKYGKDLEMAANIAQLVVGGAELAPAIKSGVKGISNFIGQSGKKLDAVAHDTTMSARDAFKAWAKDLSEEFGAEYQKIIGGKTTTLGRYAQALDEAQTNLGIQGIEKSALSGHDRAIRSELERVSSIIDKDPNMAQGAVRLDEIDNMLKKGMFKAKSGKQYTSADHSLTEVRSALSGILSDEAPELKVLKTRFAPKLQFKNEAYKILQPFNPSNQFDTTRGANFFRKAALGELRKDEGILLNEMTKSYSPKLLDELISAGKNYKTAELIKTLAKPVAVGVLGTAGAAGAYEGYKLLSGK